MPFGLGKKSTSASGETPVITSINPVYGSAAGGTTAPTITGTGLAGATSVKLNGVEHIAYVSFNSDTQIVLSTLLAGTEGAWTTISVTTNSGGGMPITYNFGDGATIGWNYLPPNYHLYDPDRGFVASTSWADFGDLTPMNATASGTIVFASTAINGQNAVNYATSGVTQGFFQFGDYSALTSGELFAVFDNPNYSSSTDNVILNWGTFLLGTYFPYQVDNNIYDDFGSTAREASALPPQGGVNLTAPFVYEASSATNNWTLWVNEALQFHNATNTVAFNTNCSIGAISASGGTPIYGGVVVFYPNSSLDSADRLIVNTFLEGKYSIPGPPQITMITPVYGSSDGYTRAPVITGSSLLNATSVLINGVEHVSVIASDTFSQIFLSELLPGPIGAWTTITVTTPYGTNSFGDGYTIGFNYLPPRYYLYDPDYDLTIISGTITAIGDQGDLGVHDGYGTGATITVTSGIATGTHGAFIAAGVFPNYGRNALFQDVIYNGFSSSDVSKQIIVTAGSPQFASLGPWLITSVINSSTVEVLAPGTASDMAGVSSAITTVTAGPTVTITGLQAMTPAIVGYNLTLSGDAISFNNGTFPIASYISPSSVTITNPSALSDVSGSAAQVTVTAGPTVTVTGLTGILSGHVGQNLDISFSSQVNNIGSWPILTATPPSSVTINSPGAVTDTGSDNWNIGNAASWIAQNAPGPDTWTESQVVVTGLTNMTPEVVGLQMAFSNSSQSGNNFRFPVATYISPSSVTLLSPQPVTDTGGDHWTLNIPAGSSGGSSFSLGIVHGQNGFTLGQFGVGGLICQTSGELFEIMYNAAPFGQNNVGFWGNYDGFGFGDWLPPNVFSSTAILSDYGSTILQANTPAVAPITLSSLRQPIIWETVSEPSFWGLWIDGYTQVANTRNVVGFYFAGGVSGPFYEPGFGAIWGEGSTGSSFGAMVILYPNSTLNSFERSVVLSFLGTKYSIDVSPYPAIDSIQPFFGADTGSTSVTIKGLNFTTATGATVGGVSLTSFSVVDDTTITGVTGSGTIANADVVVTNASGTGTLTEGFTYLPSANWTLALYGELGVTLSGSSVTSWADQSGAGHDFGTSSIEPTFDPNGLGRGKGAATFSNASGTYLTGPTTGTILGTNSTAYSVYIVCYPTAANAGAAETFDALLGDFNGYWELGVTSTQNNSVVVDHYDGADKISYTNNGTYGGMDLVSPMLATVRMTGGNTITVSTANGSHYFGTVSATGITVTSSTIYLGNGPSLTHGFTGQIAAVFAWSGDVGNTDDAIIRIMLRNYYGLQNYE